jgi:hypothetical protein
LLPAQRRDDDGCDLARGGEQCCILRRSREACERLLEMRGDRISRFLFGFLAQGAPSGWQLKSLVMITPRQRKLAILM